MDGENTFRQRLDSNQSVIGARATAISPTLVEVYADAGLDFVWIDLEHTGPSATDSHSLEEIARSGELAGISPLVRVPSDDPHVIRKVLDTGVRNVLVPRVETATAARRAVRASRYVYDGDPGTRGASAGRAANWGNASDDYVEREDQRVCLGVMIETERAVEHVEEIVATPELGFVFVGPADLSVSLGVPLETDHPEVEAAVSRVHEACHEADVPVGCIANDVEQATAALSDGYQVLRIGDEASAARSVLGDRVDEILERTDGDA